MLLRKKHHQTITTLLASLFLGVTSPILQAEDEDARWYEIEIILFEHTGSGNIDSEKWPLEHSLPALTKAAELVAPSSPASGEPLPDTSVVQGNAPSNQLPLTPGQPQQHAPVPATAPVPHTTYPLLDASEMQLTPLYQKLQRSSRHRPLLHLGWRQPTVEKSATIPVHIHGGKQYEQPPQSLETLIQKTSDEQDSSVYPPVTSLSQGVYSDRSAGEAAAGVMAGERPMPPGTLEGAVEPAAQLLEQIDGTITISRARYLHVWTDLIYRTPILPQGYLSPGEELTQTPASTLDTVAIPPAQPDHMDTGSTAEEQKSLFSLRIQDHRRMRSKEIHYMDHPLVGLIILATPYKLPEPEPEPETPVVTESGISKENITDTNTGSDPAKNSTQ